MARGRIIEKSISTSKKVDKLTDFGALLYTWMIPHTDDYGRMDGDAKSIKALVCPKRVKTIEEVEKELARMESVGLIRRYEIEEEKYLEIIDFDKYQTFRADRPRRAEYPIDSEKKVQYTEVLESNDGFTTTPIKLMMQVYARDGEKCRYCGTTDGTFEIDHIVPKSRGGRNEKENLVVSCYSCNRKKGNKTLHELGWNLITEPIGRQAGDGGLPKGDICQSKLSTSEVKYKRREVKRKEIELPEWLNKKAWDEWKQYRIEVGKTLRPTTIKLQIDFLEKNKKDHVAIIKDSIKNGWAGLFELKSPQVAGNGHQSDKARAFDKRVEEENNERERRQNEAHNDKLREVNNMTKGLADKFKLKS